MPPANAIGAYTASTTSVVAMSAPVICFIVSKAAWSGFLCSSTIMRTHDSVTQIASSTTEPITRMSANIVSVLIDMPITCMKRNVPIRETGIATAGMIVARQLWRKSHVITTTRMNVSRSVSTISFIDAFTKRVVS